MKRIIVMVFPIISISAFCQFVTPELITVSGDIFKNNIVELTWSIGETMIETYSNEVISMTQGFHQSEYQVITEVNEFTENNFRICISPNPSNDILNIQISGLENQKLTYKLIDLHGRVLIFKSISSSKEMVNISQFTQAVYMLIVYKESGQRVSSFKIQKVN